MSKTPSIETAICGRVRQHYLAGIVASWVAVSCAPGCGSTDETLQGLADAGVVADAAPEHDASLDTHPIGELGAGLRTLVGDSSSGSTDGSRVVSLFNNPVNVVMSTNGNLLVADFDNGLVREVTPTGVTTTLVRQPGFSRPFGMTFTPSGELYVQTDRDSSGAATGALWRIATDTGEASLVRDQIGRTRGLASISDGRLVLVDKFENTVRIYDPLLDTMSPLAGLANTPGFADGTGAAARFDEPLDVVVASDDTLYIADSQNHRIRKVTLDGSVTTFAGTGAVASLDGPAMAASFETPVGLALGADSQLFVSEFASGRVRKIGGGVVSTIAGSTQGFADHQNPFLGKIYVSEGLAYSWPYLYLADGNGGTDAAFHRVRRLDLRE